MLMSWCTALRARQFSTGVRLEHASVPSSEGRAEKKKEKERTEKDDVTVQRSLAECQMFCVALVVLKLGDHSENGFWVVMEVMTRTALTAVSAGQGLLQHFRNITRRARSNSVLCLLGHPRGHAPARSQRHAADSAR